MRLIVGDLWHYYKKPRIVVCVTTNGTVRKDGHLVMGRGCALEAMQRIPGLALGLGQAILKSGNKIYPYREGRSIRLMTFPVKHQWYEDADLNLIRRSALQLKKIAEQNPEVRFLLPRPGCGNGRLSWTQVKPLLVDLPNNVLVISKGTS
jgi:hypothetical protein